MKKKTKIVIGVLVVLIVIQFIRPNRNNGNAFGRNDISHDVQMPDSVLKILTKSCFDCHSNQTSYPWYSEINPVSWWLNHHINEGKQELNFSEFVAYDDSTKLKKLKEIAEEVQEQKMPLESYLILHKDAKLNQNQISILISWTEFARNQLKTKNR